MFVQKILLKSTNETIKQWNNNLFVIFLLIFSVYGAYRYGPLPGAQSPNLDMITKQYPDRVFIEEYIAKIDSKYAVAASNNIGSHFSNRERIYVLPLGIDKADVLVFLLDTSEYPDSLKAQKKLVDTLRHDPTYTLTVEKDKFVVFEKK